ncbi:glycosyltransferase family 4 protein [Chromobacterium sp. S0633]|uniref:glycosyltransferase family 4 protein n=1 Tax=Chromobacterium sp. S0633 TaxID=2957805 RepID=UPI00209E00D1|nr:glycosyltransferase family 4 protein [Chromobacterium sp. S0633]MCP1289059.1 glycosyltransferase family 4 protein [Chromobacterium sp. S0633]
MKICLVSNTSWSLFNFRHGLIQRLILDGHSIFIIAPHDNYSEKLKMMGCTMIDVTLSAKGVNPISDGKLIYSLYRLYKNIAPDFIIHYTIKPNIYGSIASFFSQKPCIAITTGLGYTFVEKNWIAYIAKYLYKIAFRWPKEVWFLNEDDKRVFLSHDLVKKEQAVLLHGEGVNMNFFAPQPKTATDKKIRFLLISRMLWDKGVGEFVQTAKALTKLYPHAQFQLLGPCDVQNPSAIPKSLISEWAQEGSIEYLGITDDVRPFISQADCIVLPSFYREGIPRTLMEAAAMGKPLITTDNVGCRDLVIEGKTGFLCKIKDVDSLVKCCVNMLELSDGERSAMGQAGRDFMAASFSEVHIINQYIALLKKYTT